MCRSRRDVSKEYVFAKIGFDTKENEPCKVCPLSVYRYICSTQAMLVQEQKGEKKKEETKKAENKKDTKASGLQHQLHG